MFAIIKILWGVAKRLLGKGGGKTGDKGDDNTVKSLTSAINPIKKMTSNLVDKIKGVFSRKSSDEQIAEDHLKNSESADTMGLFAFLKSKFNSIQTSLVDMAQNNVVLEMLKDAKDKAISLANSSLKFILSAIGTVVGILGALGTWILTPIMPAFDWLKEKLALVPSLLKKLGAFFISGLASLASLLLKGMTLIPGLILKGLTHMPFGVGDFFKKPSEMIDKLPDIIHNQIMNVFSPEENTKSALPDEKSALKEPPALTPFEKGNIKELNLSNSSVSMPKVDLKSAKMKDVNVEFSALKSVKSSGSQGGVNPKGVKGSKESSKSAGIINIHNSKETIRTHNYVKNTPSNKLRSKS